MLVVTRVVVDVISRGNEECLLGIVVMIAAVTMMMAAEKKKKMMTMK